MGLSPGGFVSGRFVRVRQDTLCSNKMYGYKVAASRRKIDILSWVRICMWVCLCLWVWLTVDIPFIPKSHPLLVSTNYWTYPRIPTRLLSHHHLLQKSREKKKSYPIDSLFAYWVVLNRTWDTRFVWRNYQGRTVKSKLHQQTSWWKHIPFFFNEISTHFWVFPRIPYILAKAH